MNFPKTLPGFRLLIAATAIYAVVWIATEGALYRVLAMSCLLSLTLTGLVYRRYLGGRLYSGGSYVLLVAGIGLILGLMVGLMAPALMVIKTGLHSHGPEFTLDQFSWVFRQIPLWMLAGSIAGAGVGLVSLNRAK